jgi:SsrA-binding protein
VAEGQKTIVQNRRARHDYHILDTYEAGIALQGTEVKSLRAGQATLQESYADVTNGEVYLVGAHIAPYEQGTVWNHDPRRRRKLLLHKREIERLRAEVEQQGLTLVPLRIYFKQGRAKVELGLAKGKKTHDRREDIKKREAQREIDRAFKGKRKG